MRKVIWPIAVAAVLLIVAVTSIIAVTSKSNPTPNEQQWRKWIGQKLMLNINVFCPADISIARAFRPCTQAVDRLPKALSNILGKYHIGGVVLFSENLQTAEQTRQLTADLQRIPSGEPPLLIAVDQEGGTVARLPGAIGPSFAGNMALGAGYEEKGTALAGAVGLAQAHQLRYLGINVNFAPVVDVNSNPANPIINTRSFGDDPERVAQLGTALSAGLQQGGIASTLKHFPGHGDSRTDSHTGLPRVDRSLDRVLAVDLLPFVKTIKIQPPDLIMIAHIQYPALDDSTLPGPDGTPFIRPATVSRPILQNLLRRRLGYDGIIVTDALNMDAIRAFFTPDQAVIESFAAGADIALMPFDITTPADSDRLDALMDRVVEALRAGKLDPKSFKESAGRVMALRRRLEQTAKVVSEEERVIQFAEEQRLDAEVARAAITVVKGASLLPLDLQHPLRLLMPEPGKCAQFEQALEALQGDLQGVACTSMTPRSAFVFKPVEPGTIVLSAYVAPQQSPEENRALPVELTPVKTQIAMLSSELAKAKTMGATTVIIGLRSPYELKQLSAMSDVQVAAFFGGADLGSGDSPGNVFTALVEVLSGRQKPTGRLPVRLGEGD